MNNSNKPIPFWSWNDKLEIPELLRQIDWMHDNGIGGFFMHARSGLKTKYLSDEWFDCVRACCRRAEELGMDAWAYDENGWPSGFVGGKLLSAEENLACYLTHSVGEYDEKAFVSYKLDSDKLLRTNYGGKSDVCLNVYLHKSPSNTDILNPAVVDLFIKETHEKYRKEVLDKGFKLKGFFTDEPQYFRLETPYSPMLEKYFRDNYGMDIKDGLGLLFVEKEGYRDFRYRYWLSVNTLMVNNFGKKIYEWCDKNNLSLTGHYIEERSLDEQMRCCAGVMPLYEYEHVPGIDWLCRNTRDEIGPKQLGSVAAQLEKKYALTESFAACGWDVTPRELKRIAEYQFVNGINLLCGHLTPYGERGQRKRDYPAHFFEGNPWCRTKFKDFNDYFTKLGEILSDSKEIVNVGVLHPMRSTYFVYKRYDETAARELNIRFSEQTELLVSLQIPHHFLDETLLEKYGSVSGNKICLGACEYDYLIIPTMYTMGKFTEKLLREFVGNGGKILLLDKKPDYLEGEKFDYGYLESNVTTEEIRKSLNYRIDYTGGDIRSCYRKTKDNKEFVYIVNLDEKEAAKINVHSVCKSFEAVDTVTGEKNIIGKNIKLMPYESVILYPSCGKEITDSYKKRIVLDKDFEIEKDVDNLLTLDFVCCSYDGESFGEKMPVMGLFQKLLSDRYRGTLYVEYSFDIKKPPEKLELLAEDMNTEAIFINGQEVQKKCNEKDLTVYAIADKVKTGVNTIVVKIKYFQDDNVYSVLFGEGITESLKNCLVYDTNIEAVYLRGNFGVFGDFRQGKRADIYIGNNFYLAEQPKELNNLITEGFPFYAGEIDLRQDLFTIETNCVLEIEERFCAVDVWVNENYAGCMLMKNILDISKFLVKGKNTLKFRVYIPNRNLLGPHHTLEEDGKVASPALFERFGTWNNGKSPLFTENYAFVKSFII